MLDPSTIKKVSNEIYRRFPQVAGVKPQIKRQSMSDKTGSTYLLIFSNSGHKPSEVPVTTYVRVTVDEAGQILKLSTSR